MKSISECYWCSGAVNIFNNPDGIYWTSCVSPGCRANGPECESEEEAITKWNSIRDKLGIVHDKIRKDNFVMAAIQSKVADPVEYANKIMTQIDKLN